MEARKERILLIAMLLSMCIWGMSWSSAKVLSGYGNATSLAFVRFLLVPLTLIPLSFLFKIDIKVKREGWWHVLSAGAFMMVYTICFFIGLQNGLSGAGGVLVTTLNPIFAFLVGLFISKIVPSKIEFIGLFIGLLAGCFLLNIWDNSSKVLDAGNTYFLLAAFVWAVMSKISAQANRFGNAIGFSIWLHVFTVLGLFLIADKKDLIHMLQTGDTKFWLNMLYFGVINSSLATTCFLFAAAKIGAEKASTFIFIVPSMALVSSYLFLGEQVMWFTVVGGALGILAVFVLNGKLKFAKK